jgi:hypothetical protein
VQIWVEGEWHRCVVVCTEHTGGGDSAIVSGLYCPQDSQLIFGTLEEQSDGMRYDGTKALRGYPWQFCRQTAASLREAEGALRKFMRGDLPVEFVAGASTEASERFRQRQAERLVELTDTIDAHNRAVAAWSPRRHGAVGAHPLIVHEWNFYCDQLGKDAQVQMQSELLQMPATLWALPPEAAAPRTRMLHSTFPLGEPGAANGTADISALRDPPDWWKAEPALWDARKGCCTPFRTVTTTKPSVPGTQKVSEAVAALPGEGGRLAPEVVR